MIRITWLGDTTGLDLKATWDVQEVRLHTVKSMLQPDGRTKADTIVLVVFISEKQWRKLIADYGKDNIGTNMVGCVIIPLFANAVLWTCNAPKGYEHVIKVATYTACSFKEVEIQSETK